MRKYLYIILLALLSWHSAIGKVVPEDKAREIAAEFYSKVDVHTRSAVQPSDFRLVCSYPISDTRSVAKEPALFVFEHSSGGYVVVSGDDVARPVLGYSLEDRFPAENMPDNMRSLFQWYSDIIEYARSRGWESKTTRSTRADLDPENWKTLQTAKWSQYSPFNDLAPNINGEKPPIGCTATAIAIIMRYHKWPDKGTGTLPSYDYRYGKIDGISLGHVYDWDKMPEEYNGCSQEEAAQIARLLYDVAVMCNMAFDIGGSGASTYNASKLIDHFYYHKGMQHLVRDNYPDSNYWEQKIKEDIDAKLPVLYSGFAERGGHAIVIDGYNGDYFSLNFGWGRASYINTLTPIEGHDEDLIEFYKSQDAVFRIMPDKGQGVSSEPDFFIARSDATWLPETFTIGKNSTIWTRIRSDSFFDFEREFRYELRDRSDRLKEVVSPSKTITISNYNRQDSPLMVTSSISDGDYIAASIKNPDTGEWGIVPSPRNGRVVFTTRPLSDLVEIGYFEPDKLTDEWSGVMDVYVKFYKDICWDIFKKDESTSFFGSHFYNQRSYFSLPFTYKFSWGAVSLEFINSDDPESDTVIMKFNIPTGSYVLRFNNPATGEKLDIKLEL